MLDLNNDAIMDFKFKNFKKLVFFARYGDLPGARKYAVTMGNLEISTGNENLGSGWTRSGPVRSRSEQPFGPDAGGPGRTGPAGMKLGADRRSSRSWLRPVTAMWAQDIREVVGVAARWPEPEKKHLMHSGARERHGREREQHGVRQRRGGARERGGAAARGDDGER